VTAYAATRDERYADVFVELTGDWIRKHPLEKRDRVHPVYKHWRGFPWLDIQTGIRAGRLCNAFPIMVHGRAFTPEFLAVFLASLYDHQVKTERLPMNAVHNKAVFEQRGFVDVAALFPEFKDARRWMALALERTCENLLAQTTEDGVQREWSGGYHAGVMRDGVEIMRQAEAMGVAVPEVYRDRLRKMHDYIFGMATPDLGFPMFGDTSREALGTDRARWPLYSILIKASQTWNDPQYAALARIESDALPIQTSYAFPQAGMYALRSGWGPDAVYFALHCSPKGISGHDQPDNGTFELYAYGRWLMPDTGFYTYGHDAQARAWHRQTRVHQTLTLDDKDTDIAGKHLLWKTSEDLDTVVVENPSYPDLTHRRTVWFVDRTFFVLLDEAIGAASGQAALHYQFAPGTVAVDTERLRAHTTFPEANVLVAMPPDASVTLTHEEGWHAWKYGHRTARPAVRFTHTGNPPCCFLTVLYPYRGEAPPEVTMSLDEPLTPGAERVEVIVEAPHGRYRLGRDLSAGSAWRRRE